MPAATPDISVVIPAFCEEEGIAHTVDSVHGWCQSAGMDFEIIVVDNASTDGTVAAVEGLGLDRVRVLVNETNRGKGWSVRRGMAQSQGQLKLHCDADCAPSLVSLPEMLRLIANGAEVVVGSRLGAGARIGHRQPLMRRIAGSSFQALCRILLREPTRDRFCGFKLWTAEAADAVFPALVLDGWTFDAEALALARALGFSVTEVGIVWDDREGSRLSMLRVLFPVMRELITARRNVAAISVSGRTRAATRRGTPPSGD
ncbi:MAG: glycosyltransferase [Actinomycetes bacterium]